ncbi:MAG TPA: hypothetical protein VEG68_10465 [Terriglobales bacterium]|nr:hypothetical protein [Terriglobales bacterium]
MRIRCSAGTFLIFALTLVFGAASLAQDKSAPSTMASIDPYLMDRDTEIAMARSAGPNSVSSGATVLVLGRHGYETAVEGKNGFVCLVGRSWDLSKNNQAFWDPKIHGPICLSAPGVRSFLPIYLKKTELALAGSSNIQIEDAIVDRIAKGELPTPEPGTMSFMLSKQGYLNEGIKGPWLPHVMFFVSEIDPKALGSDLGDDVPLDAHEEKVGRYTTIDVPVSNWSDGTPAPIDHH